MSLQVAASLIVQILTELVAETQLLCPPSVGLGSGELHWPQWQGQQAPLILAQPLLTFRSELLQLSLRSQAAHRQHDTDHELCDRTSLGFLQDREMCRVCLGDFFGLRSLQLADSPAQGLMTPTVQRCFLFYSYTGWLWCPPGKQRTKPSKRGCAGAKGVLQWTRKPVSSVASIFNRVSCPLGEYGSPHVRQYIPTAHRNMGSWNPFEALLEPTLSSHSGHREGLDAIKDQAFFSSI